MLNFKYQNDAILDLFGIKMSTYLFVCVCILNKAPETERMCKTCFIQLISTGQYSSWRLSLNSCSVYKINFHSFRVMFMGLENVPKGILLYEKML